MSLPKQTDSFGCSLGNLDGDQHIAGGDIRFYLKSSAGRSPGLVSTPGSNRGFVIGLATAGGQRRRIFQEHHSTTHDFVENSIYIRDFSDPYKAELKGPLNFILMEISRTSLSQIAEGADVCGVTELENTVAEPDPVIGGLARALFATLDLEQETSTLFVDQLSTALGLHLIQRYGNGRQRLSDKRRRLSRHNESRAKELMLSRLKGDVSIDDLATECNLSRTAFIQAFRETTGKTPNQWLAQQRIDRARQLLLTSPLSLAEISALCGFADQAHFSRTFSSAVGKPPGTWRRHMLA
ncbi:helix-turn-helix domain-containing protein [Rhizobium puerariae]|uniref:Helix-turn-helix domain-containing protein n=1 Tax=Rhizobium puerariae TaxID=1585791 RepID=A0ABV6AIF8_9HYPH